MHEEKYFKIFKIEKPEDISLKELKRRYRILAKKYHPDLGGNADSFRLIHNAYSYLKPIIKNAEKRENSKFFTERFKFSINGSVFDVKINRWIKIKGEKINIKV